MTGGHQLVHRAMQGLFKEVGLSPNFVWDTGYEIPDAHLPADHRRALEEAHLEQTVEQIQRVHRGPLAPLDASQSLVDASYRLPA